MRLCALLVALLFCVAPSSAQTVTSFSFVSQTDDYIGRGETRSFSTTEWSFRAYRNYVGGVSVVITSRSSNENWIANFAAPNGAPLTAGTYLNSTRLAPQSNAPGFEMGGNGRGCLTSTGRFTVLDVVYGAADEITSFAADFEHHCEGAPPALFGSIRLNFTPPPFTVSPQVIQAGAAAQTVTLTVVANPPSGVWSATADSSWISVPASGGGGSVPIGLARNTSSSPRTGTVTLAGQVIPITQRGNGIPGAPGRPSAVVTAGVGRIAWTPADATGGDATMYRLEVGTAPGTTALVFTTPTPSFDVTGVPPGRFYLRVHGSNELGIGPVSEELALVVSASGDTPPDAPRNLRATLTFAIGRPRFTWAAPDSGGVVTYQLEAGSITGASNRAVVRVGNVTSFEADPVPLGIYFVRVRAVNAAGVSGPSNEVLLRVSGTTSPPGPPDVTGSASGSTVTVSWTPSQEGDSALRFRLEAGALPGLTQLVSETSGLVTSLSFPGVPPGHYYVRVRGINARGVGPASNEVRIVVP